ncbi:MAG: SUMF1/EgtB/PvdO family nonheme iron enzyme, partial [Candidatus Sericytochromatia bacterium]
HQETLMYLIHQLPHHLKRPPAAMPAADLGPAPAPHRVSVPAGRALLGARDGDCPFSWDNERPAHEVDVPAFGIDAYNVTNGQFLAFMADGGYRERSYWSDAAWAWKEAQGIAHPAFWRPDGDGWAWRGLFEDCPLPDSWPVVVTHAEAEAYARYVGGALPTEPEWHCAAFGAHQDLAYPWGNEAPGPEHANLGFRHWSPTRVGAHPAGAGPLGVHDMVGNGWEWTATPFAPFEGFAAHPRYPGYSADFFDGKHWVMKGASWVTDPLLGRRSFRNWFFGHYPYMYATFRCVQRH